MENLTLKRDEFFSAIKNEIMTIARGLIGNELSQVQKAKRHMLLLTCRFLFICVHIDRVIKNVDYRRLEGVHVKGKVFKGEQWIRA